MKKTLKFLEGRLKETDIKVSSIDEAVEEVTKYSYQYSIIETSNLWSASTNDF